MTHSGGKPHAVGDRGQRYEVTYFDPRENRRKVFGWAGDDEGAQAMCDSIDAHPAWQFPQVRDRQSEARLVNALREMMMAYERRIRTDCAPEQLAKEPWRCAEYRTAEEALQSLEK